MQFIHTFSFDWDRLVGVRRPGRQEAETERPGRFRGRALGGARIRSVGRRSKTRLAGSDLGCPESGPKIIPATTYSPTQSPAQYHRPWRA